MFRFRLAKVLSHRRRLVDAAARDVAAATAEAQAMQARAAAITQRIGDFVAAAAAARTTDLDPRRLVAELGFRTHLERQRLQAEAAAVAAEARLDVARRALIDAHRDQQVLERLEEKQRAQWAIDQMHRERRELDEVAAIRAAAARHDGS